MGCTLSAQGAKTSAMGTTKVIFPGGEIQCFYEPVKAAELMLQVPNFFLVSTASLHTGKRISALKADEDLEMNEVYVLLPMKRLNSAVTAADMGPLFLASNANAAGGMPASKVLPEFVEDVKTLRDDENCPAANIVNLDDMEGFDQLRYRLSRCRSRKPSLETIVEETVNLRFMFMIEN
ncbi:uncharacterized protein [Primulina huaijiensis]|uniref:uncharacterized protein n=1 Tax=Primulina huaijiensis TaxID=1492673 RepID=UPI003CC7584E